jgi:hypothetical protein
MSRVKIEGNASGTGTFTIAAPNSNTDRTFNLPDEAGTVLTSGGAIDVDASAPADSIAIDSSGNVGIGTSSIMQNFGEGRTTLAIKGTGSADYSVLEMGSYGTSANDQIHGLINFYDGTTSVSRIQSVRSSNTSDAYLSFFTAPAGGGITERMRIDSNGYLLVGKSVASNNTAGQQFLGSAGAGMTRDGANVCTFNRKTSDGAILSFEKDGTTVGVIGGGFGGNDMYIGTGDVGIRFDDSVDAIYPVSPDGTGSNRDNAIDLGYSSIRFDDIYATNGTIQTSDIREKQDIEELSEAETRVAIAAKGLLKKFRWKDAVAEKGDEARIHFGIIAQELQAAFEAEGLDAGRYAMFIHSTWWETYTDVPAVEAVDAVYDEEGNLVSEAVEAKEAYTRTDTYHSAEEAPEGAVEKSRMGVRYSELLAFIIAAL